MPTEVGIHGFLPLSTSINVGGAKGVVDADLRRHDAEGATAASTCLKLAPWAFACHDAERQVSGTVITLTCMIMF